MIAEQQVEHIVLREKNPKEHPCVEAQILSLVGFYQELLRREPKAKADIKLTQNRLETDWASSPDRHLLVRRFVKILKDEAFLMQIHMTAGRVLVVDPAEVVTPVLVSPLTSEGYEVAVAGDASDAEQIIKTKPPGVVISELNLPFADGIEFFRRLRHDPQTAGISFLIMTSSKSKSTARKCLREGVEDVLIKPVDLEMLFLKLKRLAESRKGAETAGREATLGGGVTGNLAEMSFVDMIQIVAAGGKDVAVSLTSGDRKGEVLISKGEVIHAITGDMQGVSAFYELMRWRDGSFAIRQCADFPPPTIHTPVTFLLVEGSRLIDEADANGGGKEQNA